MLAATGGREMAVAWPRWMVRAGRAVLATAAIYLAFKGSVVLSALGMGHPLMPFLIPDTPDAALLVGSAMLGKWFGILDDVEPSA